MTRAIQLLPVLVLGALTACGGGGGGGGTTSSTPAAPAPTATISASKTNVEKGDVVTLTWSSTNATTCTASGSWNGSVATSGSQTVTTSTSGGLTYTVTCNSGTLSATADAKVTVVDKPTATLSVNQTTALTDEKVTLTWSSANANTCTLSGEATGSVTSSGTKDISSSVPGAKSISISCAGSLSSASASTSFTVSAPTTYTVSTDIAKLNYPSSYKIVTSKISDTVEDPCKLDYAAVTYPQSWMGKFALPPVTGAPLKPAVQRGIFMKDIMLTDNPTFNQGCKGSLKNEFSKTIDRLQKLGVDWVYVPQWHWAGKKADGTWYIIKAEDSFGPLSDSDLAHFVSAAHAVGIKVLMLNQIQGMIENNNAYVPDATPENYRKWFDALTDYMNERGKYFQSIGIDMWELGCNICIYPDYDQKSVDVRKFFIAEYSKLLTVMKSNYRGKIVMATSYLGPDSTSIYDSVDIFLHGIWDNGYNPVPPESLSVATYKSAIQAGGSLSQNTLAQFDRPGKSILIQMGIQSRANVFTKPGYVEETGCTAAIGDLNTSNTACIQRDTTPDFSVQAIIYEAALESIASLNLKGTIMVAPGDMWETDSMVSKNVFPNLGATIRNKPAEGILKAWYAK